nr:uncharacterized protein LOC112426122 [Macaca nemestrina]
METKGDGGGRKVVMMQQFYASQKSAKGEGSTSRLGWVRLASGILGAQRRPPATALPAGARRLPFPCLVDAALRSREDFASSTSGFSGAKVASRSEPRRRLHFCRRKAKAAAGGPRGRPNAPRGRCSRIRSGGARAVTEPCGPRLNFQRHSGAPSPPQLPARSPAPPRSPRRARGALPQHWPGHRTSRAALPRPARSSPAPSRTRQREFGGSAAPSVGFSGDMTASLERGPASAKPPPPVLTAQPPEDATPGEGRSQDFEKQPHSPREHLDPPPAPFGQMILILGCRVGGGDWELEREERNRQRGVAAARRWRRGVAVPAALPGWGNGILRLCLPEDRIRSSLQTAHTHTAASAPHATSRNAEVRATVHFKAGKQGQKH